MDNESEHVTRCPRCFGRDVRPSRKSGFLDSLMGNFRRAPFRCRGCHNRFYVYVPRADAVDDIEPAAENPEGESAASDNPETHDPERHDSDVPKPAEP